MHYRIMRRTFIRWLRITVHIIAIFHEHKMIHDGNFLTLLYLGAYFTVYCKHNE